MTEPIQKFKSIREFFNQTSPEYKQGWDDCLKALERFLYVEGGSRPGEYQRSIDKVERYIFTGVHNEYKEEKAEYRNALEEHLEEILYDTGKFVYEEATSTTE